MVVVYGSDAREGKNAADDVDGVSEDQSADVVLDRESEPENEIGDVGEEVAEKEGLAVEEIVLVVASSDDDDDERRGGAGSGQGRRSD